MGQSLRERAATAFARFLATCTLRYSILCTLCVRFELYEFTRYETIRLLCALADLFEIFTTRVTESEFQSLVLYHSARSVYTTREHTSTTPTTLLLNSSAVWNAQSSNRFPSTFPQLSHNTATTLSLLLRSWSPLSSSPVVCVDHSHLPP